MIQGSSYSSAFYTGMGEATELAGIQTGASTAKIPHDHARLLQASPLGSPCSNGAESQPDDTEIWGSVNQGYEYVQTETTTDRQIALSDGIWQMVCLALSYTELPYWTFDFKANKVPSRQRSATHMSGDVCVHVACLPTSLSNFNGTPVQLWTRWHLRCHRSLYRVPSRTLRILYHLKSTNTLTENWRRAVRRLWL
jgi:hypothetical protein